MTGEFYPADADTETMLDLLGRQVASPVQFVRGLHTLYDAGARVFVEVGPEEGAARLRRGRPRASTTTCSRCSPTTPSSATLAAFNQALCGLYAAGLGLDRAPAPSVAPGRRRRDHPRPRRTGARHGIMTTTIRRARPALRGRPRAGPDASTAPVAPRSTRRRRRRACAGAAPSGPRAGARAGGGHRRRPRAARRAAGLRRREPRRGSSRASSSSTPSRTGSASRWSTCGSPAW